MQDAAQNQTQKPNENNRKGRNPKAPKWAPPVVLRASPDAEAWLLRPLSSLSLSCVVVVVVVVVVAFLEAARMHAVAEEAGHPSVPVWVPEAATGVGAGLPRRSPVPPRVLE